MSNGLDRRDEAVLKAVDPISPPSARKTVKLYQRYTDIVNDDTAKNRAKKLRRRDDWPEVARHYE